MQAYALIGILMRRGRRTIFGMRRFGFTLWVPGVRYGVSGVAAKVLLPHLPPGWAMWWPQVDKVSGRRTGALDLFL